MLNTIFKKDEVPMSTEAPKEAMISVYIPSAGNEWYSEKSTLSGTAEKYIWVNVGGEKHKVLCDQQTDIPERFYGAVQGILDKLK